MLEDTKKVFGTSDGTVITFPASGTGGWEAAVCNTLSPGDKVLVARYGMFSHRWIDMCQRHGLDVQIIECAWGTGAPADRFQEILYEEQPYTFLFVRKWTALLDKRIVIMARDPSGKVQYEKIRPTKTGNYTFFFNKWIKLAQAPQFAP